jgi:hypothetical protein
MILTVTCFNSNNWWFCITHLTFIIFSASNFNYPPPPMIFYCLIASDYNNLFPILIFSDCVFTRIGTDSLPGVV